MSICLHVCESACNYIHVTFILSLGHIILITEIQAESSISTSSATTKSPATTTSPAIAIPCTSPYNIGNTHFYSSSNPFTIPAAILPLLDLCPMSRCSTVLLGGSTIVRDNLTREERAALENLRQRNDIIIKPADKGSAVVVLSKENNIKEGL